MHNRLASGLALGLGVVASVYQIEGRAAVDCNGCTVAQMTTNAASFGHGEHYFYDLTGNHLYLFETECEPISGGVSCYAYQETPAADMVTSFSDYHQAWGLNNFNEAFEGTVAYNVASANPSGGRTSDDGFVNAYERLHQQLPEPTLELAG
jgi:hypothetical protein